MSTKFNMKIDTQKVVFINADGKSEGLISTIKAQQIAKAIGLDLVKVGENNGWPICKLMDLGKWKYDQKKKNKKQPKIKQKTIKFSPNTAEHDLKYRSKRSEEFMDSGSSVKIMVKFSGREKEHMMETGQIVLEKYLSFFKQPYKIEEQPQAQGNTITMVIGR